MLWFFQRGDAYLRIETTHDRHSGAFSLTVYRADGTQEIEMFVDHGAFESRLEALERQLVTDHWTAKGSILLPPQSPHERPN
jgi:hypothetical protein